MKKGLIFIISAISLILVFVIGAVYIKGQKTKKVESFAMSSSSVFVREYSPSLGSDDAKVIITEFLDPACQTCKAMYPFIKNILISNQGRIKLVVRYAPLHQGSDEVVKMLEASKEQGKFWETLEVMLQSQQQWVVNHISKPEKLWPILPQAGLDIERLKKDMQKPEVERNVQQDIADAKALDVNKTPGYFVNGKPLVHFGYEELLELIRSEYIKSYPN
ncbi:MAG: thioredoxin domain-containing protein [Nitrospirota bacterium]|nr:MAG: thioredoxin domain-containing protein [Nitrospirota bacterium]